MTRSKLARADRYEIIDQLLQLINEKKLKYDERDLFGNLASALFGTRRSHTDRTRRDFLEFMRTAFIAGCDRDGILANVFHPTQASKDALRRKWQARSRASAQSIDEAILRDATFVS